MKKTLLSLTAAMIFGSLATFAQTDKTEKFQCIADTWIRSSNTGNKNTTADKLETNHTAGSEDLAYHNSVALIAFDYQTPSGMRVKKATLTIYTERNKNKCAIAIRPFADFKEDCNWDTEGANVTTALESNSIAEFTPKGDGKNAIGDGTKLAEEFQNLDAWKNDVDLTSYFKTVSATTTRVNFLLSQISDGVTNQVCFISKDRTNDLTLGETKTSGADLAPFITVVFEEDSDSSNGAFAPSADITVRSDKEATAYGSNDSMELYWTAAEGTARDKQFYGILSFSNLPAELTSDEYEIQNATLRLVTTMQKGSRIINVYDYPAQITNSTTWNDAAENINMIFDGTTEPIAYFESKGQGNKAIWDTGITEQYNNVEAWTNYVNLTEYLKNKQEPTKFSILLSKKDSGTNATKIATVDATDINNANEPAFTFAAEDLKPQLKITYTKRGTSTSVEVIIDADNSEAPVEYYNLQGVKVANPDKGIYIMRQGTKVRKVIL